jgi:maleate cis-trans isomerase
MIWNVEQGMKLTSGEIAKAEQQRADMGNRIRKAAGILGITTATAVLEALHAIGAKRVFMASPTRPISMSRKSNFSPTTASPFPAGTPFS